LTGSGTLAAVGALENKRLMESVFAELANGNGEPFMDTLGEDIRWTVTGRSAWSRTYEGKRAVIDELMRPLFSQFAGPYRNAASRIIADEDHAVVECHGEVTTKSGKSYNQTYCYVCRIANGKVRELTEYLDTELVSEALEPPAPR
jgi:ketosteroid isomerase-like protein